MIIFSRQRNIFLIISSLCFVVLFGACKTRKPGEFFDKTLGFSIKFPLTWEQTKQDKGIVVAAVSPQENENDPYQEIVAVASAELVKPFSLDEYYKLSLTDTLAYLENPESWLEEHERAGLDGA